MAGNSQERGVVLRDEVISQESASLRMGINGEREDWGCSDGSVGVQNLLEEGGSESSFALAPPIAAPHAIDWSPTMEPKRRANELSLPTTVAEECAELDLNSTLHYAHMERAESFREETSLSYHPPMGMPVDETSLEEKEEKEESCDPMAFPTQGEEVEGATEWSPFSGRLYHNLTASRFRDSINSPDLRGFSSHASPWFVNEGVDARSVGTDSSSESRRLRSSHLPPKLELPLSPHTQDMPQGHPNNAQLSFDNPVYTYDV